jgi:hypothetical protein
MWTWNGVETTPEEVHVDRFFFPKRWSALASTPKQCMRFWFILFIQQREAQCSTTIIQTKHAKTRWIAPTTMTKIDGILCLVMRPQPSLHHHLDIERAYVWIRWRCCTCNACSWERSRDNTAWPSLDILHFLLLSTVMLTNGSKGL